ncbi:MAG: type VII secretion protein EssC [Sarcina sp.]
MRINKYKIIISGNGLYRECSISDDDEIGLKIGNKKGCNIRFRKDLFFDEFELEIVKNNNSWNITSDGSVYYTTDGVIKLYNKNLSHGDELIVKYANYNQEILKISFFIDFDMIEKKYNREIEIGAYENIRIGGDESSDIWLKDELLQECNVIIERKKGVYKVKDVNSRYGIYINAKKINEIAEIHDKDFIVIVGYYFYFNNGKLYTEDNDSMEIRNIRYKNIISKNSFKYPKFNRSTRIKYKELDEKIDILLPEKLKEKPKNRLVLTLIPALMTLMLTIVLRGIMGGGGTFVIFSVCTMTLGIIMSIVTAIVTKKDHKKYIKDREENYKRYIAEKEKTIQELRKKEEFITNKIHIKGEEIVGNINEFDKDLFEKDKEDEDYLSIRIGTGIIKAKCEIEVSKEEFKNLDDELINIPYEVAERYKMIKNMPIVLGLKDISAAGVYGEFENLKEILKYMTVDVVGRHFYRDLSLFYIIDEESQKELAWLRWLKHTQNEALGIRNIVCDEESKNVLFEYLYVELLNREKISGGKGVNAKDIIVFVLDNKGIYNHPIARFIEVSKLYNVHFVFFEEAEELLPKGCGQVIKLNDSRTGRIIPCEDGEDFHDFVYGINNIENFEKLSLKLASVYVDEVTLENELTKNISLYELLKIAAVDDLDIKERWETSCVYESMAAPLGVRKKGEVVSLDLNEKYHGPHGLVAGTTGSGKSEILQSYILSAATLYHPYEVAFVIIDFKGGGMVNQFKDLPHLNGAITNIDGREITRSLLSIKAELRKRQEYFAHANVNHIDKYIEKYKKGEVKIPLPHLILVVDEFAELKSDQPEFMKELISAARIGRSLGVHLILATQKPSGVVDDQIWSNSKFKLCLKVQNKNDSNEVLKSPLAADIKEPGRAYLQVGNNEIFELFQSAYSGAPASMGEIDTRKEFEINEVNLWGKRQCVFRQKKEKKKGGGDTQLEAIVKYLDEYCKEEKIEKLPNLCMPPLADMIYMPEKIVNLEKELVLNVDIGIYDDPSRQAQDITNLNISEKNLLVIGASQFGKTNLLQAIIRGLTEKYEPNELNIYILDFASMVLRNFEKLKHVGGVITLSDDEKLKTFIKMIKIEMAQRKKKLSELGVSSFASYKEAGYKDLPHILIVIDNFTALKDEYGAYEQDYLNIFREGVGLGITVTVTNIQLSSITHKYQGNFGEKIALYSNEASEYSNLLGRSKITPKSVPGRGIISIDKEIYEYQTYIAFKGEKEFERVASMRAFIEETNLRVGNQKARIIPEIPKELDMQYIEDNYRRDYAPYEIPIGLNFDGISLETIDLNKLPVLTTIDKEETNSINFIRHMFDILNKNINNAPVKVYVLDGIEKKLEFVDKYNFVEEYSMIDQDLVKYIEVAYEELSNRNTSFIENGIEGLSKAPLILILCNNNEAIKTAHGNKKAMDKFKEINSRFKNFKIAWVFTGLENVTIGYGAGEILKLIKDNKYSIVFENISDLKAYEITISVAKNFKKELEEREAHYISGSNLSKIKVIKNN